jgi:hypothetical protein
MPTFRALFAEDDALTCSSRYFLVMFDFGFGMEQYGINIEKF